MRNARNFVVSQRRRRCRCRLPRGRRSSTLPDRRRSRPEKTSPLRTDATAEADAINRRTELVFYGLLGA